MQGRFFEVVQEEQIQSSRELQKILLSFGTHLFLQVTNKLRWPISSLVSPFLPKLRSGQNRFYFSLHCSHNWSTALIFCREAAFCVFCKNRWVLRKEFRLWEKKPPKKNKKTSTCYKIWLLINLNYTAHNYNHWRVIRVLTAIVKMKSNWCLFPLSFFFFCKEYLASYEDLCTNPSFNYKCYAVFENICYISPDNKKKNSSLLFLYDWWLNFHS